MSQQFHRASTGDTVTVPDELVEKYTADPRYEPGDGTKAAKASTKKENG